MSPRRDIALPGEINVKQKIRVRCLCGLWVVLGETDSHGPIALHPLPQCKLFKGTDLLEYIRTLRQHYEGN